VDSGRGSVGGVFRRDAKDAARHATPTRGESARRRTWRRHGTSRSALRIVAGAETSQAEWSRIRPTRTRSAWTIGSKRAEDRGLEDEERRLDELVRERAEGRVVRRQLDARRFMRRRIDGAMALAFALDAFPGALRVVLARAARVTLDGRTARARLTRGELASAQRHADAGRQEPSGDEHEEQDPVGEHRGDGLRGGTRCRGRSFPL